MLYSHCFASPEIRDRARYWLTWHGFTICEPAATADADNSAHRLTLKVSYPAKAAVQALIDSIEHAAPSAWPAEPGQRWRLDRPAADSIPTPHGTPIHWLPSEGEASDLTSHSVAEYMFSRWE